MDNAEIDRLARNNNLVLVPGITAQIEQCILNILNNKGEVPEQTYQTIKRDLSLWANFTEQMYNYPSEKFLLMMEESDRLYADPEYARQRCIQKYGHAYGFDPNDYHVAGMYQTPYHAYQTISEQFIRKMRLAKNGRCQYVRQRGDKSQCEEPAVEGSKYCIHCQPK